MSKFITERRHHNLFELKMQDETFTSNQRQDDIERSRLWRFFLKKTFNLCITSSWLVIQNQSTWEKTSDLLAYIMSHLFIFGIYIIFGKFIIPFQVCGLKQKCSITKSTIKSLLNVKSKFLLQHNCKIPFTT